MIGQEARDESVAAIHGNHLWGIYGSDAGRIELIVPFLLGGLAEESVCFLIAPTGAQKAILKAMKQKRPSLDSDIEAGRFIVSKHQKTPLAQIRFFEKAMTKAEDEGVESFRVVGDMWGFRLNVSAKQMIKLEVGLERIIIPRFRALVLCAYDARRFSGVELLDALKDHNHTYKLPIGVTLAR
jgi:hypothetical protein